MNYFILFCKKKKPKLHSAKYAKWNTANVPANIK